MNDCEKTRRQLNETRRKLGEAERKIATVASDCRQIVAQADSVLGDDSGVPRGVWSFARGQRQAAETILAALGERVSERPAGGVFKKSMFRGLWKGLKL